MIIAARNEEARIAAAIDSAFTAGAAEVIVSDGASEDRTREIARQHGARVIEGEAMRSRQFNAGARAATHDALIFLHADTTLPRGAAEAVAVALTRADFGGFRIRFAEKTRGLLWTAFVINLRTRLTRAPWGDQAQFIARSRLLADGGFREIPLMEDYDLSVRMKRRRGRTVLLPLTVTTSGRRFLTRGLVRTTLLNWIIIAAWRLGVAPEVLARWYRGGRTLDLRP